MKEQNDVVAKITVTSLETSATNAQKVETSPAAPKRIEELEDEAELAKVMDIDTDYGKHLIKRIREKKAIKK
jgi:hypothetical protein